MTKLFFIILSFIYFGCGDSKAPSAFSEKSSAAIAPKADVLEGYYEGNFETPKSNEAYYSLMKLRITSNKMKLQLTCIYKDKKAVSTEPEYSIKIDRQNKTISLSDNIDVFTKIADDQNCGFFHRKEIAINYTTRGLELTLKEPIGAVLQKTSELETK